MSCVFQVHGACGLFFADTLHRHHLLPGGEVGRGDDSPHPREGAPVAGGDSEGWDWEMVADICLLLMRYMHPWFAATGFNLLSISIRGVVATFMLAWTEMMETGLSQVRAKHVLASI